MQYILISFAALIITVFITPYCIELFNKIKVIDLPDGQRKVHSSPTPHMGGIIIFTVVIGFLFIFYGDLNSIKFFLFGCVIIIALGTYDDLFGAGWILKFLYQSFAAICLLIFLLPKLTSLNFFGIELAQAPAAVMLFIFIVGTINAFNLLDGLDGLASGISMIVSVLLFFLGLNTMNTFLLILLASFIGCMTGFLKYNAYPARIFLGDSGSLIIGYFVISAVLLLSIESNPKSLDLTFSVILLAVPIADTIKVLFVRIIHGKHPFVADNTHIHHIIFSKNITHKTTVFIISLYSLFFAAIAIYYKFYSETYGIIIFLILIIFPLIYANKILSYIINSEKLLIYGRAINRFPQKLLDYYTSGVIPAAAVFIVVYFTFLMAEGTILSKEFLTPSVIILVLMLIFTILNYKKNKLLTDIIVFFNILVFFIINQTNTILYKDISDLPVLGNLNYHLLLIAVLVPVVAFYLFFRDRLQQKREMLLTGLDLLIVLIIIMLSISSSLIPIAKSYLITDTVFRSFLIYVFYKIVIRIKPQLRISLYAFSFLTVLLSQTILLID